MYFVFKGLRKYTESIFISFIFMIVLSVLMSCGESEQDDEALRKVSFEISSWWTAEGENDALGALEDYFAGQYPQFSIVNSILQVVRGQQPGRSWRKE